jgi:hypothetical protein
MIAKIESPLDLLSQLHDKRASKAKKKRKEVQPTA